jgi:NADH dehydrogenase (ubiquinone) Fe-S protein 6
MFGKRHVYSTCRPFLLRWTSSKKAADIDPAAPARQESHQVFHETAKDVAPLRSPSTTRPVKSPSSECESAQLSVDQQSLLKRRWSPSMQTKEEAIRGPRFEYAILSAQPMPKPAIDLVQEEPVFSTDKRTIYCDGGNGALGHPKVYINLDKPETAICGYCGKQFIKKTSEGHASHS